MNWKHWSRWVRAGITTGIFVAVLYFLSYVSMFVVPGPWSFVGMIVLSGESYPIIWIVDSMNQGWAMMLEFGSIWLFVTTTFFWSIVGSVVSCLGGLGPKKKSPPV